MYSKIRIQKVFMELYHIYKLSHRRCNMTIFNAPENYHKKLQDIAVRGAADVLIYPAADSCTSFSQSASVPAKGHAYVPEIQLPGIPREIDCPEHHNRTSRELVFSDADRFCC